MRGNDRIQVTFSELSNSSGQQITVSHSRWVDTAALRIMNAHAIRCGFESPVDLRLLFLLGPRASHILIGDPECTDPTSDPDAPLAVGAVLRFPTDSPNEWRTIGVMTQVRAIDFWTLPPVMRTSGRVDGRQIGEGPEDALRAVGLDPEDADPALAQSADLQRGWDSAQWVSLAISEDTSVDAGFHFPTTKDH